MNRALKTTLFAVIASVVVNIVLLLIGRTLFPAPETFGPYTYGAVIMLTTGGVIAASIVYYAMAKYWSRKFPTRDVNKDYRILAYVILVVSFIPDILLPYSTEADNVGATWPIVILLCLMHVAAALVCINVLTKRNSITAFLN